MDANDSPTAKGKPVVVAIDMGYGHLRPAYALAERAKVPVMETDKPPLADEKDKQKWDYIRGYYENLSRASQWPALGAPFRGILSINTNISNFYPERDLSKPNLGALVLEWMIRRGLGQSLVRYLEERQGSLLTTFYMPAVAADTLGYERVFCVVTDSDINRVWAPVDTANTRIMYLVPTQRTRRRLRAYGVPAERVRVTGFPLPHELVGGTHLTSLKENLARRLVRLDPQGAFRHDQRHGIDLFLGDLPGSSSREPVHLTFAIGGAGAQVGLVRKFLPSLRNLILDGRLRLSLIAGIRQEVGEALSSAVVESGLGRQLSKEHGIDVVVHDSFPEYLSSFNRILADTDVLWTKPSEMTFYAALGLPLIFSWPVGSHEGYNRRWALESGAALKQRDPRYTGEWLKDWLNDGTLAAAAWAGFTRLPQFGLYQILEAVEEGANQGEAKPNQSVRYSFQS